MYVRCSVGTVGAFSSDAKKGRGGDKEEEAGVFVFFFLLFFPSVRARRRATPRHATPRRDSVSQSLTRTQSPSAIEGVELFSAEGLGSSELLDDGARIAWVIVGEGVRAM